MKTNELIQRSAARLCSAMIILGAGYTGAQTPGNVPIFDQPGTDSCSGTGGNDCIDSVVTQDASGNIGIGTTTPAAKLDVAGGSLNLEDSTATSGNLLKAGNPFLHNAGSSNTFLGLSTGNFLVSGGSNTGLGYRALSAIADGHDNAAVGASALSSTTGGRLNVAIGRGALQSSTGVENTATGRSALYNMMLGYGNTAIGVNALQSNVDGFYNTALGHSALFTNTSRIHNTAIGADALRAATGEPEGGNTSIGDSAGSHLLSGIFNIYVGYSGAAFGSESNTTRIGECLGGIFGCRHQRFFAAGVSGSPVTGAQVLVNSQGQLGVLASSRRFKEDIQDMGEASAGLRQLRPVTFYYKPEARSGPRQLQYGLVAEDVAEVIPNLVEYSENGEPFTVRYHLLAPMLLNEVQRQDRLLEERQRRLEALKAQLASLEQRLAEAVAATP